MILNKMDENTIKMSNAFHSIQNKRFKAERKGSTAIGKALEDALMIKENNFDAPDLHNFEVKSHHKDSDSFCTMFTKSATFPRSVNTLLRKKYGNPDSMHPDIKVLHTSIFAHKWTPNKLKEYEFRLRLNNKEQQLELITRDFFSKEYEVSAIWTYDILKKTMFKKMKNLAYINALKIIDENHDEYFEFLSMELYYNLDFNNFLMLLESGDICFDLRMGAYKTGKRKGKSHDHGSGFRIKAKNINKLYSQHYIVS